MKKLILIDDSQTQINITKTTFIKNGWEVFGATNAPEAMRLIYSIAPDLVITDALMPIVGGFQILKQIRENEIISKIPVIVYSVLEKSHAKYYLKDTKREYFLTKGSDKFELLSLANEVIAKNPVSEEYKQNILNSDIYKMQSEQAFAILPKIEEENIEIIEEEFKIDETDITKQLKESYSSLNNDEKIANILFSILRPYLNFELGVFNFFNFKTDELNLNLDINNFILSPNLQNYLSKKYQTKTIFLNKKYSANSVTIGNLEQFHSKIELEFDYLGQNIGQIAFYSLKENKWDDEQEITKLKTILKNFLKSRYIKKSSAKTKEEIITNKYLNKLDIDLKNKFNPTATKIGMYVGIINIANYIDIELASYEEEMDYLNLKLSEKIMSCLDKDEQIYKVEEDEYTVVIFADNQNKALNRFKNIFNMLKLLEIEDHQLDILIGISNCYIDGVYDIYDAQKQAHIALDRTTKNEKVIIYEQ